MLCLVGALLIGVALSPVTAAAQHLIAGRIVVGPEPSVELVACSAVLSFAMCAAIVVDVINFKKLKSGFAATSARTAISIDHNRLEAFSRTLACRAAAHAGLEVASCYLAALAESHR